MAEATVTLPQELPKVSPARKKPPKFPEATPPAEKLPGIPTSITRALARGARLLAEAAHYGDQPLPAQLKARLDRCAEEQKHLLTTARRKTQRRREPGRWMMCASGILGQIGRH